ncbi:MAG: hypothetical protein GDA46_00190 [Bdellovibrionales bacterium]|nr:hypothetical protein [Bdellovibrionales bacterium]
MKKVLYVGLFLSLFVMEVSPCFATKKYRYIKREHGVRFTGNILMDKYRLDFNDFSMDKLKAEFQGVYTYNFEGRFEFGPYFDLSLPGQIVDWKIGFLGEYNFIKNRGKRKWIPSLGIILGIEELGAFQGAVGLQASLKAFVAKRTAFITTFNFDVILPFQNSPFFTDIHLRQNIKMGFAYYFDFY